MKKDLISIIIPVYNAQDYIMETINTIKKQTYVNWEAIFVDDCSQDDSVKILHRESELDGRIKVYKFEKNSGNPSFPRNFGLTKVTGRFVCFIDSDDLWDKEKLEKQINFMKKNDIAFSYHSYEFADEFGVLTGKKVIAKPRLNYHQCLKNNIISTITVMFDLEKVDINLIKMPNLKYVEDTATWWKILRNGYTAYGIPMVLSYYRRVSNSNSSNKFRTLKKLWNLYRHEEKLNIFYSFYCFCWKNIHAILRRL